MAFLHNSLNNKKFENDKKLALLKKGQLTLSQFVNLIEPTDGYILFGPAIIDKTKIKEFVIEWKNHQLNVERLEKDKNNALPLEDIVKKFDDIAKLFPEVAFIVDEYKEHIKIATCTKCTNNHYASLVASDVRKVLEKEDRDLGDLKSFIDIFLAKYGGIAGDIATDEQSDFDVEWIKPESLIGVGYDLIDKLDSCLDCVIKHLGRAKILFEEFNLGYPDHKDMFFDELAKGNKAIEQLYLKYLDSCSHLDMGSSELVGNIEGLDKKHVCEIIELANEIRVQRISFQENLENVPDFDGLRLKVKKLQLSMRSK